MSDIGKTFRAWQRKDIDRLKNIREKQEKEDNTIWKCFLVSVVIFIIFILCYV
jgi:hypothetical protein